jgi:putative ABC transport system permease protein
MGTVLQDLRYGWRKLVETPGFTLAAVLTLALGIGANAAVFSVVRAVLLRPLPYAEPERLVLVWNRMELNDFTRAPVTSPDLVDYRREARLFSGFAATNNVGDASLIADGEAQRIKLAMVTDDFFTVLGAAPLLGRTFTPDDGSPLPPPDPQNPTAAPPAAALVVTFGFWQRFLGSNPRALGRALVVDGQPMEVVGVMPPDFRLLMPPDAGMPTDIDAWTPFRFDLSQGARDQQWLRVIGRLKPGVTLAAAQAEMDAIAARQRAQFSFHRNMDVHVSVQPMHADVVEHVRPTLLALLGAVGFVLLIACANVANLMLARAAARRREMALRAALGAGRWRIFRQVLTEGLLLAVLGGGAGLALAGVGVPLLLALRSAELPRVGEVGIDGGVLAFTAGATLLSALLFSLVPALRSFSAEAAAALKEAGAGAGAVRGRTRSALLVVQVALSLVLLIGAGLMLRTLVNLRQVKPGFEPGGVLTYTVALPFTPRYQQPADRARFFLDMKERVAALPGVEAVGAVFPLPLGGRFFTGPYGEPDEPVEQWSKNDANLRVTLPGYFEAMGIRLLAGRTLTDADSREQRPVVVVDRRLAERFGGPAAALGRRIGFDAFGAQIRPEIVGVVDAVRHKQLTADGRATIYFPQSLFPWPPLTVAVRSGADPSALAAAVRQEVGALDPEVPLYDVRPMADYVSQAMAPARFTLLLIGLFAAVAVALALVGLFGVLSFLVHQRSREIGVRMALGAEPGRILRMVVGRGALLVGTGLALGLAAAVPLTRALAGLLYGVSPLDPVTFVSLPVLLAAVALVACLLPARRAAGVDPMVSLRQG